MRILVFGKYPPIQGGTSSQVLNTVRHLAAAGHRIDVVTNGWDADINCRAIFTPADEARFATLHRVDPPGAVTIHYTAPLGPTAYIPFAQPYSSKLFGIGISLIGTTQYDLVVGWYFEPYGLVAGQIAEVAGVPLLLRHAGSDLVRLARHPDLRSAYSWLVRRADTILTGPRSRRALTELGADPANLRMTGPGSLPDYFDDPVAPIDISELEAEATATYAAMPLRDPVRAMLVGNLSNAGRLAHRADGPVVGVCGKVAETKGSYDLLAALERMAGDGVPFTLLGALGGQDQLLLPFFEALAATDHLRRRSIILPFLAPWRMPAFFDACDVVCLLERSFDVDLHLTRLPWEVLRRGRALVLSQELSQKVWFRDQLQDGGNYLAVDDPEDIDNLVAVLAEALIGPDLRTAVAGRGRALGAELMAGRGADGPSVAVLEALAALAPEAAAGP